MVTIMTSQDIFFSVFSVFKPTQLTNMKKQCQSCPFTQIKSFKNNCGTGYIVNGAFVTHKHAAAADIRHTYYSTGNNTGLERSNSSHELKYT
jgi:hypothetical protein